MIRREKLVSETSCRTMKVQQNTNVLKITAEMALFTNFYVRYFTSRIVIISLLIYVEAL